MEETPVAHPETPSATATHQPAAPQSTHGASEPSHHAVSNPKKALSKKMQEITIYIYGAISVLLFSRFIFSLVGARQVAPYVEFVYQLTTPIMIPFSNMFGINQSGQYRIEFEVLVALLVYALIFYGIGRLARIIFD